MIANRHPHFASLRAGLLLLAGTIALGSSHTPIAAAQSTFDNPNVFNDVRQGNERDPLLGGSDIDMMDLIHRANLSGGRSLAEFAGSQSSQIQSAASDFRALQLQRLYQTQPLDTPAALSLDLSE
ncbi:MAG: hypothetical protein EAZ61_11715 [Oscillatoriales cyanobacterium]|jgi:hypothetical protein|nr:MAG: hypothetical protein EAZ61_11715 [Oscillatoriales cyanobacterium]